MKLVFITLVLVSQYSMACLNTADCTGGARCVKEDGELYGECTGGFAPGRSNDSGQNETTYHKNTNTGNTCSYDYECGAGGRCRKGSSALYGVCQ